MSISQANVKFNLRNVNLKVLQLCFILKPIKDIQKARSKGDLEKASMIQSVLDQLLQDQN